MNHALDVWYFTDDNEADEPVTVTTDAALDQVLAEVLSYEQPHPTVVVAKDRPRVGAMNLPDHQIKFDVDVQRGLAAIHAIGPVDFASHSDGSGVAERGSFAHVTLGKPVDVDGAALWIDRDARVPFPQDSIIPLDKLRQALREFMATGRRPTCVDWQETDIF